MYDSLHMTYKSIQCLADFTGKYASLLCRWKFANIFCDLNGVQCGKNLHVCWMTWEGWRKEQVVTTIWG